MKKLINISLVLVMLLATSFALFGCNNKPKVKVIDIKLTDEQYAYAVNKNETALLAEVNKILADITADGTFSAIVAKYFGESADPDAIVGIENIAQNTPNALIVATNAEFAPFEYKNGNKFCGIDIEVAKIIADKLGRPLYISDMKFDAVLTDVNVGNSHMGMAGLTVNAEREKLVTFTSTYFDASQKIIVMENDTRFNECKTVADVETILKGLTKTSIGFQNGTTGELYIKGSEDFGFDGYANLTPKGYKNGALAVQDMINGNLSIVVIDELPASSIVASINKKK